LIISGYFAFAGHLCKPFISCATCCNSYKLKQKRASLL
jgi:hypothetical protein